MIAKNFRTIFTGFIKTGWLLLLVAMMGLAGCSGGDGSTAKGSSPDDSATQDLADNSDSDSDTDSDSDSDTDSDGQRFGQRH